MLNLILELELIEKAQLKFGTSLELMKIKNGQKKYHDPNPKRKSFGAKVIITMKDGKKISEQLERADAHPYGSRPFKRNDYIKKFKTLTDKIISRKESLKFLNSVQRLKKLKKGQLTKLNIEVNKKYLKQNNKKGIF